MNPGFARLIVGSEDDRTELDLAADARLFPAESAQPAPTLRGEELAVDKVLALFGRAGARNFVDLTALEPLYGLDHLCRLAAEKDHGFTPVVFAEMLGQFQRLRRDEFELDDAHYEQLPALPNAGASAHSSWPGRTSYAASETSNAALSSDRSPPSPGAGREKHSRIRAHLV